MLLFYYNMKKILNSIILTHRYIFGNTKRYFTGKEKSKIRILLDLLGWYWKEKEFNSMYYAFGLNLKGTRQKNFIGKKEFLKLKASTEKWLRKCFDAELLNYDVITRDKFYSASILQANAIPCIPTIALIHRAKLIFPNGAIRDLRYIYEIPIPFFIKNILIDGGDGVFSCLIQNSEILFNRNILKFNEFEEKIRNGIWIIQKEIKSHKKIRRINESALNTTRIVTILNRNEPEYLCGFQAFATNNETIDSWGKGSIYVGIDIENENLKELGLCNLNDKQNGIVRFHPDSKIVFKDYPIPFLKDAVNLCLYAHRFFYFNFIIGWDVAITDEGPIIVEVNESPGMNVVQCLDGGLRNIIRKRLELTINHYEY